MDCRKRARGSVSRVLLGGAGVVAMALGGCRVPQGASGAGAADRNSPPARVLICGSLYLAGETSRSTRFLRSR